jgi:hypothetical protein
MRGQGTKIQTKLILGSLVPWFLGSLVSPYRII